VKINQKKEFCMKTLEVIIKEARVSSNIDALIKELEIYRVQSEFLALIEEQDKYIRVLPKNSMFFIDILEDTINTIDERNYIRLVRQPIISTCFQN
jgi:hypothetical protein